MYLIRKKGQRLHKAKAHIWIGNDTACRMWSTGGLVREHFELCDGRGEHKVCWMCSVNSAKEEAHLLFEAQLFKDE
jgi:hypothetical protein